MLEIRLLYPGLESAIDRFFRRVVEAGDNRFFLPHPLNSQEAARRTKYTGADLYYALADNDKILAYGMLRGWDEGYEIPSLGIAVDPSHQGKGYGRLMMEFLHAAARFRGVRRIRLKVHAENAAAVTLYSSLGYRFMEHVGQELIGYLDLSV